jgi:hypothetical protein
MKVYNKLLKQLKSMELVVLLVLVLFLVSNVELPVFLANLIDSVMGRAILIVMVASLFLCCNPLLGILGIIVALELLKRAKVSKGTYIDRYTASTETKKEVVFSKLNNFPVTLEETIVNSLVPVVKHRPASKSNYVSNDPSDTNLTSVNDI